MMKKQFVALFFVILIAFLLRFYRLGDVPTGFHADEAAFGYNAYSILETGKDEYGKTFPIILRSFDDYKGALYTYISVPFVGIFGLTPFAARAPGALFGVLTVILIYLFTKKLLKNSKIALISSLIFAISPWGINISRTTGDVMLAIFFTFFLAYSLLFVEKRFSKFWLVMVCFSSIFAITSYAASRFFVVFIPLLFLVFSLTKQRHGFRFNKIFLIVLVAMIVFGVGYSFIGSIARFNQLSIFSHPQTELVLQEQIREDQFTPVFVTRAFHNKIVNYSRTIIENFGQYFTLNFLALHGGLPQREQIPSTGLFYLWEIPFILIGLYAILRRKKRNEILLVSWWFVMLIPAVITFDETPNVHRTLIVFPAMIIIIAIGVYEFFSYKLLQKFRLGLKLIGFILVIVGIYELLYYGHQYFIHQNVHQPWYRGYAYKGLVASLNKYAPSYKKIILTKGNASPYIYLLFYSKYDPKKYQLMGSPRDYDYATFGKYYFNPSDCPLSAGKTGEDDFVGELGVLYINKGICVTPLHNVKLLDTIYWQDNSAAFKLLEYVATDSAIIKNNGKSL